MVKEPPPMSIVFGQVSIRGRRVFFNEDAPVASVSLKSVVQTTLFTPAEYQDMALFLKGQAVADEEGGRTPGLDYTQDFPLLSKHIENVRLKLRLLGLRPLRVSRYGSLLLPEQLERTRAF